MRLRQMTISNNNINNRIYKTIENNSSFIALNSKKAVKNTDYANKILNLAVETQCKRFGVIC